MNLERCGAGEKKEIPGRLYKKEIFSRMEVQPMERQNFALSLPKDIINKAKIVAIKKDTSLSNLIRQALEEIVEKDQGYDLAMKRHFEILEKGLNFNLKGNIPWTREDLHER